MRYRTKENTMPKPQNNMRSAGINAYHRQDLHVRSFLKS